MILLPFVLPCFLKKTLTNGDGAGILIMLSIEIRVRSVSVLFKMEKSAAVKTSLSRCFIRLLPVGRFCPRSGFSGGADHARKNHFGLHGMQKQKLQQR